MTTLTPAQPIIQVRELTMAYGDIDVLRGIDLDIHRGEVFALLGPNGAGKTTTVEILEGFRQRSAGEVRVLGADPERGDDAWRGRIGLVLQSWRDHRRWRVAELLTHFATYYPDPRDPTELLALVGLTDQADQQVDRLSGGRRRRLDVALGIVGRPELLFLDEPTTGFDPEARHEFHVLVERLARDEGVTVLLTTHDLVEAERLADRIAMLVGGRIRPAAPRRNWPGGPPHRPRSAGRPTTGRPTANVLRTPLGWSGNSTGTRTARSPVWRSAARRWRTRICTWCIGRTTAGTRSWTGPWTGRHRPYEGDTCGEQDGRGRRGGRE